MAGDEVDPIVEDVIQSIERSAEVYGLSRSAGRVFGVLYFAAEPLTIGELVDRTGYAKSTISNVTRRLTRIGMLRRLSSQGGGRKVQFETETNVWYILQDVFQQYVAREMQASLRTFDRAERRLAEIDDDEAVREIGNRLRTLREDYDDLQRIVELSAELSTDELLEAIETYRSRAGDD